MTPQELFSLIKDTQDYNLHSHTEFCDGHATLSEMAGAAAEAGMRVWAATPHSPICVESKCNMSKDSVPAFLEQCEAARERYDGTMRFLTSMEIDFINRDFGPHIDYFQRLPLDFRLGSVHFVPNQEGIWLDCDGRFERFAEYLRYGFNGDLRYVVEKYFEQVLAMLELGGIDMLGHFDKIIGNAAMADATIESQGWYEALVDDVVTHASASGVVVEINTKAFHDKGRFFPHSHWWDKLKSAGVPVAVNSDAHYPEKVNLGRREAISLWNKQKPLH